MATHFSDQAKKMFAQSTAGLFESSKGSEVRGKVRTLVFDSIGTKVLAQDDLVVLGVLPKGYRPLGGRLRFSAHGAAVTLDIGTYTRNHANALTIVDVDFYLAAHDISAAGVADFANTLALNMLAAASADEHVLVAEYNAANPTDDATLIGWLKYIAPDS